MAYESLRTGEYLAELESRDATIEKLQAELRKAEIQLGAEIAECDEQVKIVCNLVTELSRERHLLDRIVNAIATGDISDKARQQYIAEHRLLRTGLYRIWG